MKKIFFLAICIILTHIIFAQKQHPLVGTWRLVSQRILWKDSSQAKDATTLECIKTITPNNVFVFAKNRSDNTFSYANMGNVQFSKESYTESITHSSFTDLTGKNFSYTYEMKGSKMYKHGKSSDWAL